jgi:hypothetical protein
MLSLARKGINEMSLSPCQEMTISSKLLPEKYFIDNYLVQK